jgi:ABC-type branched-subunit amino acid transport system substrate-binding protein
VISRKTKLSLAAVGAAALVLSACGGSSDDGGTSTATSDPTDTSQGIVTGTGVTSEPCPGSSNPDNGCIYLGVISDLTEGPFVPLALEVVRGQEGFWKSVNDNGGVAGFDVNISQNTRDNKYDPAVHSQEYRAIEPNILALAQTLGTPQTQAILPDMDADNVIGAPASWWSGWQFPDDDFGVVMESGASYCIAIMSGMDWYVENNAAIDTVMSVGPPGDFGGDVAAGTEAWAGANSVEFSGFVEQLPNAVAGNQDAAVQQILAANPDVVTLGTGPAEVAEIIGKAAAQGYTGKFVGSAPTWNPILLQTAAAPALLALYTNVGTTASFGSTDTIAMQAMEKATGGNVPANDGYTYGWVWQYPMLAALEKAAASGDLTREGLRAAITGGLEVDYEGALPNATVNGPSSEVDRSVTISVPDEASTLGIRTITTGYTGPTAEAYDYSAPCSGA